MDYVHMYVPNIPVVLLCFIVTNQIAVGVWPHKVRLPLNQ
jgi:hypothetical protein